MAAVNWKYGLAMCQYPPRKTQLLPPPSSRTNILKVDTPCLQRYLQIQGRESVAVKQACEASVTRAQVLVALDKGHISQRALPASV